MLLSIGDLCEELVVEVPPDLRHGATAEASAVRVRGGIAANVAAITCERGGQARFFGNVGGDAMGRALMADLQKRGVDVRAKTSGATGVIVNLVTDEYRTALVDRGMTAALDLTDESVLDEIRQLFVPGRSFLADPMAASVDKVVEQAKAQRIPLTLSSLAAEEIAAYGAQAFGDLIGMLKPDTFICTTREYAAMGINKGEPIEGADTSIVCGPSETLVITRDNAGNAELRRIEIPETPVVVDRTGSHDGFIAGYLRSRGTGALAPAAVDAAHRVMSVVLSKLGPTTL